MILASFLFSRALLVKEHAEKKKRLKSPVGPTEKGMGLFGRTSSSLTIFRV